jgi:tetratricopeptide (TPR) repeat protein
MRGSFATASDPSRLAERLMLAKQPSHNSPTRPSRINWWQIHDMANGYTEQGALGKALELCEQCLEINKANLGPRHTSVAATLNSTAAVFAAQGELDKALEASVEALEINKASLGLRHTSVADTLNNMGIVLEAQGKLDKALETYE